MVQQVQQDNITKPNNLEVIVERIMGQNGFNVGLHRPKYISPLIKYVLQSKLPRGWKVPKYTKFFGDTDESAVKHIAIHLTKGGAV